MQGNHCKKIKYNKIKKGNCKVFAVKIAYLCKVLSKLNKTHTFLIAHSVPLHLIFRTSLYSNFQNYSL